MINGDFIITFTVNQPRVHHNCFEFTSMIIGETYRIPRH